MHSALAAAHGRALEGAIDWEASVRIGIESAEATAWQSIVSQRATDREVWARTRTEIDSAMSVLRAEHELRVKQMESSHGDALHLLQSQIAALTSELESVQGSSCKAEADLKAATEQLTKVQAAAKGHAKTKELLSKSRDELSRLQQTTEVCCMFFFYPLVLPSTLHYMIFFFCAETKCLLQYRFWCRRFCCLALYFCVSAADGSINFFFSRVAFFFLLVASFAFHICPMCFKSLWYISHSCIGGDGCGVLPPICIFFISLFIFL